MKISNSFIYIALAGAVYYTLEDKSKKTKMIFSSVFLTVVIVGQAVQIPAIYKARTEYLALVEKIESGEITHINRADLPTAKLGNIKIITFGGGLGRKYPNIFK